MRGFRIQDPGLRRELVQEQDIATQGGSARNGADIDCLPFPDPSAIVNALTVDVEDYFQVSAFASRIPRESWDALPSRIERNVERVLGILDERQVKATFFTLGWIGHRHSGLVRRIVEAGHELASHGYAHRRASEQSRDEFYRDISDAKRVLEDAGGVPVVGYRAPSFSIGERNLWALEAIARAGYRYSSSIYPIRHDHYGMPVGPRFPFRPDGAEDVLELPVTTMRMAGRNFPAGGGGYFRLLPYRVSRWCLRRVHSRDRRPCVFYFHPWEIDPEQPRFDGLSLKTRFRHYVNLARMERRLRALLKDFRWDRVDRVFPGVTR